MTFARDCAKRAQCLAIDCFDAVYRRFNPVTPLPTCWVTKRIAAVRTGNVNFYAIRNGHGYICVDSGFGPAVIRRELAKLNIDPSAVTHIFLTHSDFDHTGGAAVFSDAALYLSEKEIPLATGEVTRKLGIIRNPPLPRPFRVIRDGETLLIGDTRVMGIDCAGHTPGSMSYLINGRSLFTGDAFRIIKGKARPIRPIFTMDPKRHLDSIHRLARLKGVQLVLTAHRGCTNQFKSLMQECGY